MVFSFGNFQVWWNYLSTGSCLLWFCFCFLFPVCAWSLELIFQAVIISYPTFFHSRMCQSLFTCWPYTL